MTVCAIWAVFVVALSCATTVVSQGTDYQFTMDVTSSPPIPGKPYTLTWTGGDSTSVVYIIFNYYFPDTPDQNIIYITTDILCKYIDNYLLNCGTDKCQQMLSITGLGPIWYL